MTILQAGQEELETLQSDHDCNLTSESGCKGCERIAGLKHRLATHNDRMEEMRQRATNRTTHVVVESDEGNLTYRTVSI